VRQRLGWKLVTEIGQGQQRHREGPLPAQAERLAAGHEHLQAGAGRQQLGHRRPGRQDLLEIVQHQQQAPLPQVLIEALDDRPIAKLAHVDDLGHRR
jgi:hypothetical protein